MSKANKTQVGGDHYKKGGEEHWDRAWRLHYDCFQYIITKWVERWRDKGGIEDLKKARHAIDKYIECAEAEAARGIAPKRCKTCQCPIPEGHEHYCDDCHQLELELRGYVDQDKWL